MSLDSGPIIYMDPMDSWIRIRTFLDPQLFFMSGKVLNHYSGIFILATLSLAAATRGGAAPLILFWKWLCPSTLEDNMLLICKVA